MGMADHLFAKAQEIAAQYQYGAANLEREIFDLESQLEKKKAALHLARVAAQRARDFVPMLGPNFYCPVCWIENEERAVLHPIPADTMRGATFARVDSRFDMTRRPSPVTK